MDDDAGVCRALTDAVHRELATPLAASHDVQQSLKIEIIPNLTGLIDGALAMDNESPVLFQQELRIAEALVDSGFFALSASLWYCSMAAREANSMISLRCSAVSFDAVVFFFMPKPPS